MIHRLRPAAAAAALLLALPGAAHANLLWPGLYLEARMLSAPVILLGLAIETAALRFAFGLAWGRAGLLALAVNLISAALGVALLPLMGLLWELPLGLSAALLKGARLPVQLLATFGPLSLAGTFVLAVLLTAWIERAALRGLFKLSWSKQRDRIWLAANALSVALAFAGMLYRFKAETGYRPWLFF